MTWWGHFAWVITALSSILAFLGPARKQNETGLSGLTKIGWVNLGILLLALPIAVGTRIQEHNNFKELTADKLALQRLAILELDTAFSRLLQPMYAMVTSYKSGDPFREKIFLEEKIDSIKTNFFTPAFREFAQEIGLNSRPILPKNRFLIASTNSIAHWFEDETKTALRNIEGTVAVYATWMDPKIIRVVRTVQRSNFAEIASSLVHLDRTTHEAGLNTFSVWTVFENSTAELTNLMSAYFELSKPYREKPI